MTWLAMMAFEKSWRAGQQCDRMRVARAREDGAPHASGRTGLPMTRRVPGSRIRPAAALSAVPRAACVRNAARPWRLGAAGLVCASLALLLAAAPVQAQIAPEAPTELTAVPGGNQSVTLSWMASADDRGSAITGHEFRYGTNFPSDGDWTEISDSAPGGANETSYTVSGLQNGIQYYFEVRARNAVGASGESDSAFARAGTSPPAPTNLRAIPRSTLVRLSWTTPGDGGTAIVRHQVRIDGGSWSDIPDSAAGGANANSYTRMGLIPGREYTFEVRVWNRVGWSAASNLVSATPGTPTDPLAPTSLMAAPGGDQSVTLSWTASADDRGYPITKHQYRLRYVSPEDTWHDIPDSAPGGANETGYTVSGLENAVSHSFVVRAVNEAGSSGESNIASARAGIVPSAPTNLMVVPALKSVVLSWTTPNDGTTITKHELRVDGGNWGSIPNSAAGEANANGYTRSSPPAYEFTWEVRARNAIGRSAASNLVTAAPLPPPDPPTNR